MVCLDESWMKMDLGHCDGVGGHLEDDCRGQCSAMCSR